MTTNIALKHKYKRNKCLGHFSTEMLSRRLLQLYTLSSIDHTNTIHVKKNDKVNWILSQFQPSQIKQCNGKFD